MFKNNDMLIFSESHHDLRVIGRKSTNFLFCHDGGVHLSKQPPWSFLQHLTCLSLRLGKSLYPKA